MEYKTALSVEGSENLTPEDPEVKQYANTIAWLHKYSFEAPTFHMMSQLSNEHNEALDDFENPEWDVFFQQIQVDIDESREQKKLKEDLLKVSQIGQDAVNEAENDVVEHPSREPLSTAELALALETGDFFPPIPGESEAFAGCSNPPAPGSSELVSSLGCTLQYPVPGNPPEVKYASPFMSSQKSQLVGMHLLKRNVADYVFYTSETYR